MIEIKANLIRGDSDAYVTGECVECIIKFYNHSDDALKKKLVILLLQVSKILTFCFFI